MTMTIVSSNNAIDFSVRVGRIVSDCMPGAEITYLKNLDAESGMNRGGLYTNSGNYSFTVAVAGSDGVYEGRIDVHYGSKEFEVQRYLSSQMTNDMIREEIVYASMEAFKKYCLNN